MAKPTDQSRWSTHWLGYTELVQQPFTDPTPARNRKLEAGRHDPGVTSAPASSDAPTTSGAAASVRAPRKRRYDSREVLLAALLLLPNLALLAVFTYRPLLDNIRLSFFNWNISSPTATFLGVGNYVEWATRADTWQVVSNTAIFTVATVLGSMAIGLGLALLLDQKLVGRGVVRSMVFAPFVISGAAIGVAFQFVFDPSFGLIQDLLRRVGLTPPDFYQNARWALFMVTATYIWKTVGYVFVIYLAALQGRRAELDEAAEIDGTSAWRRFWRVVFPQLRPTTFFLSVTVLLNSMQVFDIINVMTRGGPFGTGTTTMVYQVYLETFVNGRAGYGATIATIMFVILLVITLIQVRLQDRQD
ncbi:sn-glycerol 3-phosphate transport system permease protein [Propionibacteriaceae bacterium ES.041]|uniref:Glycerol-3-phosphate ABC transporter permease n=1 Tax=Enemella evansiae TaxID=2016499 RepID=A0A255FW64_9ACTN|nr:glycerol-3-phosphate ABC transporter permease [Enemella evansiae]OYN93804.1 glycerol-3-phosphate ABC transporter permease [Enemella evansiae]OYO05880.1 glycerol-3-phosphate ABC transporter permease [Enemella evansiae]OYO07907.1 glycerol-3-phosphate ABC transporter permease [Enemella evansiae]PFG66622.1 sn-glycerol 3-phosphate transport system permease protein [Propionibacteriaceae bacterium ES.041]